MNEYDPHNENVAILGMQGSGKTTLAKKILDGLPKIPRWIWSPQRPLDLYGGYGEAVASVKEMSRGAYLYCGEFGPRQFDEFCERAMQQANLLLVIDDVHEYVRKQQIPPNFARVINSGRNRGICSIFLSPAPNLVHNTVLQACQHIYCYRMGLESQVEWLAKNYFGPDAYVLLPRRLRKARPSVGDEYDILPPHAYIYKKHTDTQTSLVVPEGSAPPPPPQEPEAAAPPPPPDNAPQEPEAPQESQSV